MRFKSLGSGSTGNALLIEHIDAHDRVTRILVDCGFTQKELLSRLMQVGLAPKDLSAIFITHEHVDHMGCAPKFAKRWGIPLWMSEGTALNVNADLQACTFQYARDNCAIDIGSLRLLPFTVPHDAREPLQLKIDDGRKKLALLTDLGVVTDYVIRHIYNCHALVLEANHDPHLLRQSKYPPYLIRRVAGTHGHLSNQASADILKEIYHDALEHVVAAHLSQQNNRPEIVAQSWAPILKCAPEQVCIADPLQGTPWLDMR